MVGESADETIVTYDDYALKAYSNGELYNTFNSYTALIGGDDFTAERISFVNSQALINKEGIDCFGRKKRS
ncbi:hypothetical protein [Paenibacillus sp. NEAU-GSW1]|uniref:hypothetical protein n=1 Tax=Paenibacillus sp. NEAU-GSW1 TaxID=2682486 RepID=UPI0020A69AC5|nr:hypothetical protein [Paenibacillus sp. NEAU-GSW1]